MMCEAISYLPVTNATPGRAINVSRPQPLSNQGKPAHIPICPFLFIIKEEADKSE